MELQKQDGVSLGTKTGLQEGDSKRLQFWRRPCDIRTKPRIIQPFAANCRSRLGWDGEDFKALADRLTTGPPNRSPLRQAAENYHTIKNDTLKTHTKNLCFAAFPTAPAALKTRLHRRIPRHKGWL
jgi:hypothetical protein